MFYVLTFLINFVCSKKRPFKLARSTELKLLFCEQKPTKKMICSDRPFVGDRSEWPLTVVELVAAVLRFYINVYRYMRYARWASLATSRPINYLAVTALPLWTNAVRRPTKSDAFANVTHTRTSRLEAWKLLLKTWRKFIKFSGFFSTFELEALIKRFHGGSSTVPSKI